MDDKANKFVKSAELQDLVLILIIALLLCILCR